jgi:putative flippase GtrA
MTTVNPLNVAKVPKPPAFLSSFSRAQVASSVASALDYGTLFFLAEICHVWYVLATATGALTGAIVNFIINRHWSFQASHLHWRKQAQRYALVSTGSLLLNTSGVYLVTEYGRVHYAVSVILVSLAVGFLFNYPLHKNYVYRG